MEWWTTEAEQEVNGKDCHESRRISS